MSVKSILLKPVYFFRDFVKSPSAYEINDELFTRDDLINAESELGKTIFGPIPDGHERAFFEQRKNVWIWHESWLEQGRRKDSMIRFEVRPEGVFKRMDGGKSQVIVGAELENFRQALHAYLNLVEKELYC